MFPNAQQAYDQGAKTTASNRQLEAAALFKVARMLEDCQKQWDAADRREQLRSALKLNQKLWTFFQGELARPDHGMPVDLRIDLLRISAFIDRRTLDLMTQPAPELLTALIDINRNIASGLSEAAA